MRIKKNKTPDVQASTPNVVEDKAKTLSGFNSPDEVAAAAPETTQPTSTEAPAKTRKPYTKRKSKNVDETPVDPRVNRFFSRMTGDYIGAIGSAPYEIWAWLSNDPQMNLSAEERQDWADGVYTLISLLDVNLNSPKAVALSLIAMQLKFALVRYARLEMSKGRTVPSFVRDLVDANPEGNGGSNAN